VEIQNYTTIKMSKLKVSFDKRWRTKQMKSLGKTGSGKIGPFYMTTIKHRLSIYTSMKHSLLSLKLLALGLKSLDTLSDVRIKAFTLLF
jgi:hypothetical protein